MQRVLHIWSTTWSKLLCLSLLGSVLVFSSVSLLQAQERVEIDSPKALLDFFETIDYTPAAWQSGIRIIPRVYVMAIGKNWKIKSANIQVIDKKRIFFRALAPLILNANEFIQLDRQQLLVLSKKSSLSVEEMAWLNNLAQLYKVTNNAGPELTDDEVKELIVRVDSVPVSLVLAQGAEESGWGTSRFAAEGNALFGQWTWGGKGIKPKQQRSGMGDYRIAAFDKPLESVQAYMLNINSHNAYRNLRNRRGMTQAKNKPVTGWDLAETLLAYSERGAEYVESLHSIMRVNKLGDTDMAVLAKGPVWEVYPAGD